VIHWPRAGSKKRKAKTPAQPWPSRGLQVGRVFLCSGCGERLPDVVRADHERRCLAAKTQTAKYPRAKLFSGGLPGGAKRKTVWE
jgi:hypothetical protein